MLKKCFICRKLIFLKYINYLDNSYCKNCFEIEKKNEEIKRKNKEIEILKKKREKAKIRNKLANEKLKEEIKQEKLKNNFKNSSSKKISGEKENKQINKNKEKNLNQKESIKKQNQKKNKEFFDKETIKNNSRLLYIEFDLKHILVIDWFEGRKKIMLNKNRELRKTHAGGFSAEKFQKFVDAKKNTTYDWIIEQLSKPGIIRKPYDKIKIVSKYDDIKKEVEKFIESY